MGALALLSTEIMAHGKTVIYLVVVAAMFANAVTPQVQTLAISRVNVVDIVDGRIVPNSTVTISGETIASVIQNGAPPSGARVVDGRGKFLIPGLWDMHAHIQGSGEPWLKLYMANGVTGIRDMGADLEFILEMREATLSGRILGPRIVAAGPILDDAPGDWPLRMRVRNAEEGRAAVQLLKQRGVDLIKVHNFTPRDAFFSIADEAHRQSLPLAGHVPLKVTVQEAVDAGLTNIEHLSEDGRVWKACSGGGQYRPEACQPFFEMLARRSIWQTPTLVSLSEVATIGTPASAVSSEHLAYANKRLRDIWAGNQSLFATRPEVVRIVKAFSLGQIAVAQRLHQKFYPLFKDLFIETNPIPVKAALAMMGQIEEEYRLPLVRIGSKNREVLRGTLKACGVL